MGQRGSFVTEYIYCHHCLDAALRVLIAQERRLCSIQIPGWVGGTELPIIAGKIGGSYAGEEFDAFEEFLIPKLELTLCHPLRIGVFSEDNHKVFVCEPSNN